MISLRHPERDIYGTPTAFQFSPDGRYLAVAQGSLVSLVYLAPGERPRVVMKHVAVGIPVGALRFSRDMTTVVAVSGEGRAVRRISLRPERVE